MSDHVRDLVWRYFTRENFRASPALKLLAIALADAANDKGRGISEKIGDLAKKSNQSVRAVQAQLRQMESIGLLRCDDRSVGGVGKSSVYSLDLAVLVGTVNPERGSGLTMNAVQGSDDSNPERRSWFDPLSRGGKGGYVPEVSSSNKTSPCSETLNAGQAEYRRLAEWMRGELLKLNPRLRQPSWAAWCRDIRFLHQRDKVSLREIAAVFRFANGHPFWCSNILSPGKLRKHWDALVVARGQVASSGPSTVRVAEKSGCAGSRSRPSCSAPATMKRGDLWFCRACHEETERESAHG